MTLIGPATGVTSHPLRMALPTCPRHTAAASQGCLVLPDVLSSATLQALLDCSDAFSALLDTATALRQALDAIQRSPAEGGPAAHRAVVSHLERRVRYLETCCTLVAELGGLAFTVAGVTGRPMTGY